ncbi:MAG: TonB-dependent receptor, partial [Gammaproteobacteria bacterium]|nr:TonB-dependent receptor [Gammaproteobacteria bacterium]
MSSSTSSISIASTFFAAILTLIPFSITAQVLEEIVVTAERRETSLQEVPISIDVVSSDEINLQGYRTLDDLSKFSPSVQISNGIQEQNIAIRSFSTRGNSLTLQSAAPVFLDGVHFGRMSMVKTAFLDTERVEILKGPQPLHFGMNATAGAFNIQSARPTDTWQGNLGT